MIEMPLYRRKSVVYNLMGI